MANKIRKPLIRFKGFTDDWEQRKLNTYLDVSYDVNDEGIYDKNDVLSVSGDFGVVNQIEFQGRSFAGASVLNYGVLQRGQVVYTKSPLKANPYGIIKANKGKTGIVSVLYGVYQPKENVDSNFIESYFSQNARLNNYLRPLVNKGAKNTLLISDEDAMLGEVVFPCVDEQVLISTLFERINNLITLHQRKLDKLLNIKKSMLDKMFPKNGSDKPEIRFKGFTDAWEQRKFEDLVEIKRGLTYSPTSIRDSGIRVLRSSNINEDSFFIGNEDVFVDRSAINIPFAKNGDILITSANGSARLVGKHAIIKGIEDSSVVHGGFMLLAITDMPEFVNALMGASWYSKFIDTYVAGGNGSIGNLNKSDLDNQIVTIPNDCEKKVIGAFFEKLDSSITLHQRKLEKLKNLKKACLERMFV